jgi:GAF domain-containing protein
VTGEDLAELLGDLARKLQQQPSEVATLEAMTHSVVGTLPGAEYAGVTLVHQRREVETVAATDPLVELIDAAQYETGQGPCLDALWESETVQMSDVDAESRWPQFTLRARGHGVRSMLSTRLFVHADRLGALNTYAASPDAFPDEALDVIRLLATHAAVALASARKINQLSHAVATRDVIGQAKGILMERHKVTADEAFNLLVQASQHSHLKLREVAERLTETGRTPGQAERH